MSIQWLPLVWSPVPWLTDRRIASRSIRRACSGISSPNWTPGTLVAIAPKGPRNPPGGVGLGVPGLHVAGPAAEPEQDHAPPARLRPPPPRPGAAAGRAAPARRARAPPPGGSSAASSRRNPGHAHRRPSASPTSPLPRRSTLVKFGDRRRPVKPGTAEGGRPAPPTRSWSLDAVVPPPRMHWLAGLGLIAAAARASPGPRARTVNNLKVLSDQVDDVTTVENVLRSFVRPGMSDQERARAIWTAAVKYRHQTLPPDEFLAADWEAHDPVKIFNVYGYCMCCCSSALVAALNRADGREARGRILNGHSVAEVRYGDGWHMFDASLITHFPRPADGVDASVDEIREAVAAWYADPPRLPGRPAKLDRADGPRRLDRLEGEGARRCWRPARSTGKGYFPAGTHGWDATMAEYDRKPRGLRVRLPRRPPGPVLAPARRVVRPRGGQPRAARQHGPLARLGRAEGPGPGEGPRLPQGFLPGYRGGVVGNGVHRYAPDLAAGDLAAGAEVYENLEAGGSPALRAEGRGRARGRRDPDAPRLMSISAASSGSRRSADRPATACRLDLDRQRPVLRAALVGRRRPGTTEAMVDLPEKILRRYAYWLKVEIARPPPAARAWRRSTSRATSSTPPAPSPGWPGAGTRSPSPPTATRPSPPGRSPAGSRPTRRSRRTRRPARWASRSRTSTSSDGACWWKGGVGRMTVPIEVPGDLVSPAA